MRRRGGAPEPPGQPQPVGSGPRASPEDHLLARGGLDSSALVKPPGPWRQPGDSGPPPAGGGGLRLAAGIALPTGRRARRERRESPAEPVPESECERKEPPGEGGLAAPGLPVEHAGPGGGRGAAAAASHAAHVAGCARSGAPRAGGPRPARTA